MAARAQHITEKYIAAIVIALLSPKQPASSQVSVVRRNEAAVPTELATMPIKPAVKFVVQYNLAEVHQADAISSTSLISTCFPTAEAARTRESN